MPDRHRPGYMKEYDKNRLEKKNEYNRKNYKQINVRFSMNSDEDILSKLDSLSEPVTEYIRRLIREDIARNQ